MVKQCLKNIVNLNLDLRRFDQNGVAPGWEVIVVDNNSGDGIEQMMRQDFPIFKFIQTKKNLGMGAGNNLGIKNAKGKYVLILNPDVVVLKDSIEKLLEFIRNNPQAGCVAPKLLYPNRSYQQSCYRFPKFFIPAFVRTSLKKIGRKKIERYFMNDIPTDKPHQIDWARGSALLARKDVLDKIGGFDENFFMYLEDTDLCRRIWRAGYEVWYVPSAEMIHYYFRESNGGIWIRDLFKKIAWIHIISWFKYFWKWRNSP